jgi:beta-lactam-binding protein with PASTA domain
VSIGGLAARLRARAGGGAEVMPDLAGLSLRQANEALASRGLVCRNDKKGPRVTRQDPEPGQSVTPGSSCMVIY